jgi:hypothetical protein
MLLLLLLPVLLLLLLISLPDSAWNQLKPKSKQ